MTSLYTFLLSAHLLGAGVSLAFVLGAVAALFRHRSHQYVFWVKAIALAAVFQLMSGVGLMVSIAGETSLLTICARVAVYMVVVCGVETALVYRIKQAQSLPVK